ncbi:MAG: cellulose synthase/poly-beta-1,6-N-acetylglucosamine synthase-like glycosyltransferase [Litorivivens sp.]|jgi:cellulose synthase/poly-beta-1,6-N-acetylglucosamine synthase-like glycosyltransferase
MLDFSEYSLNDQLLLGAFVVLGLIQFAYLGFILIRISLYKTPPLTEDCPPVSVVICARNEEKNLRELVPLLMDQDYPEFELVVVNDASWDDTAETLEAFQVAFPRLHVVNIDENKQIMAGKKFALTLGIKGAKNEHLLMTDADCRPRTKQWIRHMMAGFTDEKSIVLGVSPYKVSKGPLNWLIRSDAFQIMLMYVGAARMGMPYMGVGRNLAYRKEQFFAVSGFKSHYSIQSGDDDLFIRDAANKTNTTVVLEPDSIMVSEAKTTFGDWVKQKRRHVTTAPHYKIKHKILLSLWPLSWLGMLGLAACLISFNIGTLAVLIALGVRWLGQILIFSHSSNKLGLKGVGWTSPVSELLLILTSGIVGVANVFNKPKKWM